MLRRIWETYPRPILAFVKVVERDVREKGGTIGLFVKGLRGSVRARTHNVFYSIQGPHFISRK